MKLFISVVRTVVGVLFIFSGLIKADDPLGLSYKMQEFFEVWNIHFLDHLTLAFSILMIVFEIVAGVAVLLGWRMKVFGWLLLMLMIFFTFLTGYAYLSGKVRECGCFGDCIPLTAGESFVKDLVLSALVLFLFGVRDRIKPFLLPAASVAVLVLATVGALAFQWFVLIHLPVVDCLPYKAHNDIIEKMKAPPGSVPDSSVITMVYDKGGKRMEFDASHFPKDFDDSYHFVSRYDKLIRKGNADPAIKDFILLTGAGVDTTQDVLGDKKYQLFLFSREAPAGNPYWVRAFGIVLTIAKSKKLPLFFVTGDYDGLMDWVEHQGIAGDVTVLKCDATAIKTAARADAVLYLVKGSTILKKWSYADFEKAIPSVAELSGQ
jgi:uncharacterized membrane protein YphA (DoxX/SURF4 family)